MQTTLTKEALQNRCKDLKAVLGTTGAELNMFGYASNVVTNLSPEQMWEFPQYGKELCPLGHIPLIKKDYVEELVRSYGHRWTTFSEEFLGIGDALEEETDSAQLWYFISGDSWKDSYEDAHKRLDYVIHTGSIPSAFEDYPDNRYSMDVLNSYPVEMEYGDVTAKN